MCWPSTPFSLTHQNLVLLPKKTWCWWLNLLPPANRFSSSVLHLKQETDKTVLAFFTRHMFSCSKQFYPCWKLPLWWFRVSKSLWGTRAEEFSAECPHLLMLYARAEACPHASFNHNARYVQIIHCHQACICVVTPADQAWKIKSSMNSFKMSVGEEGRNEVFSLNSHCSV